MSDLTNLLRESATSEFDTRLVAADEIDRLLGIIAAVVAADICPECGSGCGFNIVPSMPDGEPEQVQCMWCDHARRALGKEQGDE